jgi:3-phenylpropionate/trans-cinnamate dioxygenase ferredoxin reductase subunit
MSAPAHERVDVLVVGAGQGGAQAAAALRLQKFAGSIALVGEEPDIPYERPPLSKEYLAGEKPFERILLRPAAFWAERNIELRLGTLVTEVDAAAHTARLSDGRTVGYGSLVWAAGGHARRLTCSGHDLVGVHSVRSRADVDRMRAELEATTHVVIVGGGYIGLEAAAVLSKLGPRKKSVIVLEALDRVLARVAGAPLSRWYEEEHRAHGVDVRLGAQVVCIEEKDGRAVGVRVIHPASGGAEEVLPADMVIVGVGIVPAVQPLIAAGAAPGASSGGGNGVLVDLQCKTSLPDVYAIGDCAAHPNVHAHGTVMRLESVQNAMDQATLAARLIAGTAASDERYTAIPWFWSNQYDLRLQTIGLSLGHDEVIVRGSLGHEADARSFSLVYLRQNKVIALDCVNTAKDYVQGKALIAAGHEPDRAKIADTTVPLKSLLVAAP